ncbi:fimbrial protein [Enterobacter kobei]|uniref:fimbrial protein n=1 Tax=Enterobacter kobei TaxID=208224 RepID=UPI000681AFAF|nr:fimbrial protein [Enterobacter kobei]
MTEFLIERLRLTMFLTIIPVMLFQVVSVQANTKTMDINIYGNVVSNGSCTFNNNGPLTIDFGTVLVSDNSSSAVINGDYVQDIASNFTCTGDTSGLLQLKFSSNTGTYVTTDAANDTMTTSKSGVGIQLLWNGVPQSMNVWVSISTTSQPVIQARLRQTGSVSNIASGDTFTAAGTLLMAFN